ncbi:glycosyltransferase family 4 protein [Pseudocolwellia agarivorans]|uniref:glycosyltransferase family 4 protein n=1 Tax=Pseudocolwellia agarivorans TaxID=1911682 RepID=UPI000986790F|nr:glycosyltransferase [Pseudocolwellia agarivorans]
MTLTKVRIIHETNPRKYFPALFELGNSNEIDLVGEHRYSVFKEWLRAWLVDRTPFMERTKNALNDLIFRFKLPFIKNEVILMGFAPWDWRLLFYKRLAKHNKILYHTSWHDWDLNKTPRQPYFSFLKKYLSNQWKSFITHSNVKVIAVTKEVAKSVTFHTKAVPTVIPHAVPDVFFQAGLNRVPNNEAPLKLLYVGEISEKKGIKQLLSIVRRFTEQEVVLTVVGKGPLESLVRTEDSQVNYLGAIYDRSKLALIMSEHDVLMLLSQKTQTWEELFGIVIVEAIASGCAVIATDHIGPRDILGEGEHIGLFKEKNTNEVSEFLRDLLNSHIKVNELKNKQNVATTYSISKVKKAWLMVISEQ